MAVTFTTAATSATTNVGNADAKQVSGRPLTRVLEQKERALKKSLRLNVHFKRRPRHVSRSPSPSSSSSSPLSTFSSRNASQTSLNSICMASPSISRCSSPTLVDECETRATIQALPYELLSLIFEAYVLPSNIETKRIHKRTRVCVSKESSADPTVLTHVCSQWRNISISMSSLWKSVYIRRPRMSSVPKTKMWVQRACVGSGGLEWSIEGSHNPSEEEVKATKALLTDVFWNEGCVQRWTGLKLVCVEDVFRGLPSIPSSGQSPCPRLGNASILLHPSPSPCQASEEETLFTTLDTLWSTIHTSPSLHTLHWGDTYALGLPTHAPWEQLIDVNVQTPVDLDEFLGVLKRCVNAKRVCVANLSEGMSEFDADVNALVDEHIHLPNLQTLSIVTSEPTSSPLFSSLSLPSLKSLSLLHYDPASTHRYPHAFRSFLERSKCELETFEFVDEYLNEDDLVGYLSAKGMQSVNRLGVDVRGCTISERVIDGFTLREGSQGQALMPKLRSLEMGVCNVRDGVLGGMVESRSGGLEFVSFLVQTPSESEEGEDGHEGDCEVFERLEDEEGLEWKMGFLEGTRRWEMEVEI